MINFLKGYVQLQITGETKERFLNLCSKNNIYLWNIKKEEETLHLCMCAWELKGLQPIIRKTGIKFKVEGRFGMPFFLSRYRKRKMFFAGILLCAGMLFGFSLFIWDIGIEGNSILTDEVLYSYLKTQNVQYGSMKSKIHCSEIEEELRNEFDQIIWASVEMKGTRLVIHVQESIMPQTEQKQNTYEASSIYAEKEGIVSEMITRSGTPVVGVGEPVSAGALLVDGKVEIIGDDESVMETRYVNADADIYLETSYTYEDVFSLNYQEKEKTGEEFTHYYIKAFSGVCDFVFGSEDYEKKETVTEEKQLKLWNNFYLPVYFGKIVDQEYVLENKKYSRSEAESLAGQHLDEFCLNLQRKGVQIIKNDVTITVDNKNCHAFGNIQVIEKTGESRTVQEEIMEPPQEEEGLQ